MTIRHSQLEALFGARVEDLKWVDIARIVDARTDESQYVEFKRDFDQHAPKAPFEFAKDVCALANAQGGAIIFGVREENEVAIELTPIKFSEDRVQQMRSFLHSHSSPNPEMVAIRIPVAPYSEEGCLLVFVPPSPRAPHAVQKEKDSGLRYVARSGSDTKNLTESEVAERYGHRFERAVARDAWLTDLTNAGRQNLVASAERHGWITLSLVPEKQGYFAVSQATVSVIEKRSRSGGIDSDRGLFGNVFSPIVRAGLRRLRIMCQANNGTVAETYLELHMDGSGFGARELDLHVAGGRPSHEPAPGRIVTGADICRRTAEVLRRLCEHAQAAGCSGAAILKAGVVIRGEVGLGMLGNPYGILYPRSTSIPTTFDSPPVSIVLEDVHLSPRSWMVTTRQLLQDLFNSCAIPDVPPILESGERNLKDGHPGLSSLVGWRELNELERLSHAPIDHA